jgi:hypothetical protein
MGAYDGDGRERRMGDVREWSNDGREVGERWERGGIEEVG